MAAPQKLVEELRQELGAPSVSAAVGRGGVVLTACAAGLADQSLSIPAVAGTRYRIASISKPITAAAILQLAERKLLALDDAAVRWLPEFQIAGADSRLADITIRHLLQHRAGWDSTVSGDPMFRTQWVCEQTMCESPPSPQSVIKAMARELLAFDPGTEYRYSNFGYCVLGQIIEAVTQRSYADYVQTSILKPLGMKDCAIGSTNPAHQLDPEAHYYDRETGPSVLAVERGSTVPLPYGFWSMQTIAAHGGWVATASDLVRFGQFFDRTESLVSTSLYDEITLKPVSNLPADVVDTVEQFYGLGVLVHNENEGVTLSHAGSLPGTTAYWQHRADGTTTAVLVNTREFTDDRDPFLRISRWLPRLESSVE